MIVEGETGEATGGRRRRSLAFNSAQSRVVAAAVDTTHTRIAVTDLGGTVVGDTRSTCRSRTDRPVVLDQIAAAMADAAREARRRSCRPVRGRAEPARADRPRSGRPSQPPILPGWDAYPVAEHLQAGLPGVPVLTANDADAAALGEYAAGHDGLRSLCLVKVSTGIGTGIVIDGRSYTGADGGAGDIGTSELAAVDALCQCGMQGCLAAVASGRAVAAELTALGTRPRPGTTCASSCGRATLTPPA